MTHLLAIILVALFSSNAYATLANDVDPVNPLPAVSPDANSYARTRTFLEFEDADRFDEMLMGHVVSGCYHPVPTSSLVGSFPNSLTTTPCIAYPGGHRVRETAASVDYTIASPGTSSTCWLIVTAATDSTYENFVRVPGSHYMVRCESSTRPTIPSDSILLQRTIISGAIISNVTDYRRRSPIMYAGARATFSTYVIPEGQFYWANNARELYIGDGVTAGGRLIGGGSGGTVTEECSTCGGTGVCFGGTNDGDACNTDTDCTGGGQCGFGTCDGGTGDGDACTDDADCAGGGTCEYVGCLNCNEFGARCDDGSTLVWDAATERFTCRAQGVCDGGTNDGSRCTIDTDCPTGTCVFEPSLICVGGTNDGDACTQDTDCAEGGRCVPDNDVCVGGDDPGASCTEDADCIGTCTALLCADAATPCANNADCTGVCVDSRDKCDGGTNDGELCYWNSQCPGGFCAACSTCLGGTSDMQVCNTDAADCPNGICIACTEGEVCIGGSGDGTACTQDTDCPEDGICSFQPDGVGVVGPPSSTDGAFAAWDGDTGKYLRDSNLRMVTYGMLSGPTGYAFRARGTTPTTAQSIFLTFPWEALGTTAIEDAAAWYDFPLTSTYNVATGKPTGIQFNWLAGAPASAGTVAHTQTYWSASTYPVTVFAPGVSTNSQLVARVYFTEPVICPDDWDGSYVKAGTAFTAEKVYNIQKNGSTVGTATFAAAGTTATKATSGGLTSYAAGDYMDIDGPATADTTGADLSFNLLCYRAISDEVAQ